MMESLALPLDKHARLPFNVLCVLAKGPVIQVGDTRIIHPVEGGRIITARITFTFCLIEECRSRGVSFHSLALLPRSIEESNRHKTTSTVVSKESAPGVGWRVVLSVVLPAKVASLFEDGSVLRVGGEVQGIFERECDFESCILPDSPFDILHNSAEHFTIRG